MKTIQLTQGFFALVDDEDFERVNQLKWHVSWAGKYVYAKANIGKGRHRKTQTMHRFILGLADPAVKVDHHPDSSGLNNQRNNLRTATQAQNVRNQHLSTKNTSGLKGASWKASENRWYAQITVLSKTKSLGLYRFAIDAARAYDAAALRLHGEFAATNVSLGILPESTQPDELGRTSCGFGTS